MKNSRRLLDRLYVATRKNLWVIFVPGLLVVLVQGKYGLSAIVGTLIVVSVIFPRLLARMATRKS